jgi:uncharacterized glyoxalase superfamily protein PhnB
MSPDRLRSPKSTSDSSDSEYARLQGEGVPITTPIETEPWGERFFRHRNGLFAHQRD